VLDFVLYLCSKSLSLKLKNLFKKIRSKVRKITNNNYYKLKHVDSFIGVINHNLLLLQETNDLAICESKNKLINATSFLDHIYRSLFPGGCYVAYGSKYSGYLDYSRYSGNSGHSGYSGYSYIGNSGYSGYSSNSGHLGSLGLNFGPMSGYSYVISSPSAGYFNVSGSSGWAFAYNISASPEYYHERYITQIEISEAFQLAKLEYNKSIKKKIEAPTFVNRYDKRKFKWN
jgi:hypothetical protein